MWARTLATSPAGVGAGVEEWATVVRASEMGGT